MTSPDRLPLGTLVSIELRTVGLALAREGSLAVGAFALVCVLTAATAIRFGDQIDLFPELLLAVLPVALILPWIVWKGDRVFGPALLWTLPVKRQRAAAAKIAAGALWLMVAVLLTSGGLALTVLVTGGRIGVDEVRLVGDWSGGAAAAVPVRWTTPLWAWLMPFGGALLFYLAASAVLLGVRYPLRWLGGIAVTVAMLVVLAQEPGPESVLSHVVDALHTAVMSGTAGLDCALTGGANSFVYEVYAPGRRPEVVWRELPSLAGWATALAVWLAAALLALALAIRRHWER